MKNLCDDINIEYFIENGIMVSSFSNPKIEIPYAILKFSELNLTHMIDSVYTAVTVEPFIAKNDSSILYFYVDGYYPFIMNFKFNFKKLVIFTTEKYAKFYTEFMGLKNVYIMDNYDDMMSISSVDNDYQNEIIHYFIVDDNIKAIDDILNSNINKYHIIIQMVDNFINNFKVVSNNNYDITERAYSKLLNYMVLRFKRKLDLKFKPEVISE